MLRPVRGASAPPLSVRFPSSLVSWISIAAGLLVATGARAQAPDTTSTPPPAPPPIRRPFTPPVVTPPVVTPQAPAPQNPAPQTFTPPVSANPTTKSPKAAAFKSPAYRLHLHGGLFAPIDVNATSPTLGLRFGRRLVSHVQGGFLVGWTFQRKNLEEPVNGLPGLQPHRILARIDGQLVPAMLFLQVDLNETRFIMPYAGIGAGKEWFMLRANDYRTGGIATATYSNYAWEGWGGIGLRLGPDMTLDSELYYNGGSLERDVSDSSGQSYTEAVHANGVGARVGLNFLF